MVAIGKRVVLRRVVPTLRLSLHTAFGDRLDSGRLSPNLPRDAAEAQHPRAGPDTCRRVKADDELRPPAVPTRCLLGELSAKPSVSGSARGRRIGHLLIAHKFGGRKTGED
jgi:hypothetical protein